MGLLIAAGAVLVVFVVLPLAEGLLSGGGPSATQSSGAVYGGTADCAFSAADGDYTDYVTVRNVQDCTEVSAALATFGTYWSPFPYAAVILPDSQRACLLDTGNGAVMTVYQVASDSEPIGAGLAVQVCQSEEANGWTAEINS